MARNAPFGDEDVNGIDFAYLRQSRWRQLDDAGLAHSLDDRFYVIDIFPPHREMWVARSQDSYLEVLWLARVEFDMPNYLQNSTERQQILCLLANNFLNNDVAFAQLTAFPIALLALRIRQDVLGCGFCAADLIEGLRARAPESE